MKIYPCHSLSTMADETQHWVYCYRCGNEFNHSAHSWDEGVVTTPPTHMSEGTMTYTCTVCNSTRLEVIPATTEHDYSQQVIADEYLASAATCTEAATYYYSCECGEKGSGTFAYGEPLGHDYVLDKDESGHWEECSACHAQTEKQPHVFGDGETCSECGYEREHGVTGVEAVLHTQNSQRQTQLVQTLFNINDVFNYTNLAVEATIVTAGVESKQYVEGFTVSAPDMTTAGQKQVTITYEGKTTTYNITVLDLNGVPRNSASVTVDKNAVVGVSGGIVTVNSINDAVTVFKLLGTDDNVTKVINVAAGEYYEKVEIDIPKVELVGGTTNAADTVIWYDLIAAIVAPGTNQGYSTDGAATVSIRESATGFHAQNITFRNYYNTYELYLQSQELAAKTDGNTQAVACLVDADMCVFDNVIFTGYHDTLYARYGRQVYNYCHIEGRTDYVFGYSATAYFNECTFKTLGADGGNNGGYVAATRGCKTGAADAVEYGYVFYKCYFIADTNVVEGTVSLARAWGEYMTLAFIECDISSAYSLSAYGEGVDGKNVRYEEMSGVVPDPERIFEYGNTGAGALTNVSEGTNANLCTILTAERAADFMSMSTVFAAQNGGFAYSKDWDGNAGVELPLVMSFDGLTEDEIVNGNEFFGGNIIINEGYHLNGNSVRMDVGSVIYVKVQGTVTVTWFGGVYGTEANGNIIYADGYAQIEIIADETATGGIYIVSVTVDTGTVPDDTPKQTISIYEGEVIVGTMQVYAGEKISYADISDLLAEKGTVKAVYADAQNLTEYDFDTTITGDMSLYVVFLQEGQLSMIEENMTYTYSNGGRADGTAEVSTQYFEFTGCYVNNSWLKYGGEGSSIRLNVAAGAVVSLKRYSSETIYFNGKPQTADENGMIVYTAEVSGYLVITADVTSYLQSISVKFPVEYKQITADYSYTYAANGINGDEYVQINAADGGYIWLKDAGYIKMNVAAGATITLNGLYIDTANGWDTVTINETRIETVSGSVTFYSESGGDIVIATAGSQSSIREIHVTFSA